MHDDGETLKGYLKDVAKGEGKFGITYELVMVDKSTGDEFNVVTGGTAKYLAQNILIHKGVLKGEPEHADQVKRDASLLGHYIEIAPMGSYDNKRGQTIKKYKVSRDPALKIGDFIPKKKPVDNTDSIPF
jgi:hypothetical protein